MSGGSMNYLYHLVRDAEFHAHSPEREAFRKHLALVANALRSIEWNDSGDGDDQEVHNIMACISLSASENEMLRAEVERLTRERDEARAEVENLYDQVHRWVDDRAKAQSQADRLREQNYELQRERDEARAEVERLRETLKIAAGYVECCYHTWYQPRDLAEALRDLTKIREVLNDERAGELEAKP